MANTKTKNTDYLKETSKEILDKFEAIESAVNTELKNFHAIDPNSLIQNTFTNIKVIQSTSNINAQKRTALESCQREPAIARVVVVDEENKHRTYYISRNAPPSGIDNMASYHAPIGRLAELPLGGEAEVPRGYWLTVIARTKLFPNKVDAVWDSKNSEFESEQLEKLVTVTSLRSLISQEVSAVSAQISVEDILSEKEGNIEYVILEGKRKSVLTSMKLRDQPILDQYQGKIFRLPINRRLMVWGPPGTGKTTTLIRRLGQKLQREYLDEHEKALLGNLDAMADDHSSSWMMFAPTELLKHYLKEAFAREGVAAPDTNVKTWHSFSKEQARTTFGILRDSSRRGFIFHDDLSNLQKDTLKNQIEWFADFDNFQKDAFIQMLHKVIAQKAIKDAIELKTLIQATQKLDEQSDLSVFFDLVAQHKETIVKLRDSAKGFSDKELNKKMNLEINKDASFLDSFAAFLTELDKEFEKDQTESFDENEEDEFDEDEVETDALDEQNSTGKISRKVTVIRYKRALATQARNKFRKRSLRKTSKTSRILDWLDNRVLDEKNSVSIGERLVFQSGLKNLLNSVSSYFQRMPNRYQTFRRSRLKGSRWYENIKAESNYINELEIDVMMLAILKISSGLLNKPNIINDKDAPWQSIFSKLQALKKNQIYVDEVTDFSPIQLACMAELTHNETKSLFACGDFNQRVTRWGTKNIDDIKWAIKDIEVKKVDVAYRQSHKLTNFANAIVGNTDISSDSIKPETTIEHNEFAPAIYKDAVSIKNIAKWIADRIKEIESYLDMLPSIAVFVNNESDIKPACTALKDFLQESNINVEACLDGKILGQDQDVRVFSIEHIKGLEFEAVFFVEVDKIAQEKPDIFTKYLYVGATRAATFLGLTCTGAAPEQIERLQSHFVKSWSAS